MTNKKDIWSSRGFNNSVEIEDEVVHPARVGDIVEEMSYSIAPEVLVLKFVVLLFFIFRHLNMNEYISS